jgi:outer membrane autotransporter protein
MSRSTNLKRLLTTTSILTLGVTIAAYSHFASADAQEIVTNGNVSLNDAANWHDGATGELQGIPETNSWIKYGADGHTINANVVFNVLEINLDGKNPGRFTVNENVTIGSIYGAHNNKGLNIQINNGKNLTLTGTSNGNAHDNDCSGLGQISFGQNNTRLIVNSAYAINLNSKFAGHVKNATIELTRNKLTLNHDSAKDVGTYDIGNARNGGTLIFNIAGNPNIRSQINFNHENSVLQIDRDAIFSGLFTKPLHLGVSIVNVNANTELTHASHADVDTYNIGNAQNGATLIFNIAGDRDIRSQINFNHANAVLQINQESKLSGEFGGVNLGTGTVNVNANTKLTRDVHAKVGTYNIGHAELVFDLGNNLDITSEINFNNANSKLVITKTLGFDGEFGGAHLAQSTVYIAADTTLMDISHTRVGTYNIYNAPLAFCLDDNPNIESKINFEHEGSRLNINKSITFSNEIGNANVLRGTIVTNADTTFSKNVTASRIEFGGGAKLIIANDLTIDAQIASNNSALVLEGHTLTANQNINLIGNTEILTTVQANNNIGNIVLAQAANVDLTAATEVNISILGSQNAIFGTPYNFITGTVSNPSNIPLNINSDNAMIKWDSEYGNGVLTLTASDNSEQVINDIVNNDTNISFQDKASVADAIGSTSSDFKNAIGTVVSNEGTETASKIVDELMITPGAVSNVVGVASSNTMSAVNTNLANRINMVPAHIAAAAAGDEVVQNKYGVWVNPLYSVGEQQAKDNMPGYKISAKGATVGFDRLINDGSLVGVAMTYVKSDVKYKNQLAGDKAKIDSYLLSFYGRKELKGNFFAQGFMSAGYNKVDSKAKRGAASIGFSTASSKFSTQSYSAEVLLGHDNMFGNVTITPMVGGRYSKFIEKGYTEKGSNLANFRVGKKKYDKVELVLGLKSGMTIEKEDLSITPQIYGFITQGLKGQKHGIKARLVGSDIDFPVRVSKATKTSYNLGGNLMMNKNALEYGINYDLNLAKKYKAHQAGLKLKVSF